MLLQAMSLDPDVEIFKEKIKSLMIYGFNDINSKKINVGKQLIIVSTPKRIIMIPR